MKRIVEATARTADEAVEKHNTTIQKELLSMGTDDELTIVMYHANGMDTDGAGMDVRCLGRGRYEVSYYSYSMDTEPEETDLNGVLRFYEGTMHEIENLLDTEAEER